MSEIVEEARVVRPPSLVHPVWRDAYPWLVQGTTTLGEREGGEPFDLGLYGSASPKTRVHERWVELAARTGMVAVVHARQVHGRTVRVPDTEATRAGGLVLAADADAHATDRPGVLLGVTAADCVPVTLVDPDRRAVAMAHAGWRGVAAGVLEAAVATLGSRFGSRPSSLRVHLGPAICGRCYEVGPEVFEALGLRRPPTHTPVDLRAVLVARAESAGVPASHVTVSAHCTRCTGSGLFSHRGGDAGRHVGYVGIRTGEAVRR